MIENDAQDEEFELGLARKDLLLIKVSALRMDQGLELIGWKVGKV